MTKARPGLDRGGPTCAGDAVPPVPLPSSRVAATAWITAAILTAFWTGAEYEELAAAPIQALRPLPVRVL